MELIQKPCPESKVMSWLFGKGAQGQHGVGVSNHEAKDSLFPGRILVYFLLGSSVLCIVSIIRRMVTAGLHYGQTNKNPNCYTATSSSTRKPPLPMAGQS